VIDRSTLLHVLLPRSFRKLSAGAARLFLYNTIPPAARRQQARLRENSTIAFKRKEGKYQTILETV